MNLFVLDFELEDEEALSSSSSAQLGRKILESSDDALFERIGPVVHPFDSDRSDAALPGPAGGDGVGSAEASERFMEEDEMAARLHYQIGENEAGGGDLYGELLDPLPYAGGCGQIPAYRRAEGHISVAEHRPPPTATEREGAMILGDSTAVCSNETPGAGRVLVPGSVRVQFESGGMCACEKERASSSGASERVAWAHTSERKRKAGEGVEPECHSEDRV